MFRENELRAQMARKGVSQEELAKALGISASTLWRKIKADGNFTRNEIGAMIDFLELEDPDSIFFAKQLA